MSNISITTPNDGETIDASDVSTPLNTIVNVINGNLDSTNIKAAGVDFSNLLSTIFSGQVTTYTNPGSGGGTNTFFYINLGGIKLFWGETVAINTAGAGAHSFVVTLPGSFFTTVQSCMATATNLATDVVQYANVLTISASSISAEIINTTGTGGASSKCMFFVVGT